MFKHVFSYETIITYIIKNCYDILYIYTKPNTKDNLIIGIDENNLNDLDFKRNGCVEIINKHYVAKENIFAIGDSAVDKKVFELSAHPIAINPKGGIENYAEYLIEDNNLYKAINFINKIKNDSIES